jgi:hypothetical protein
MNDPNVGRTIMFERSSTGAFVLAVLLAFALMVTMSGAQAAEDAKDPNKYPKPTQN